MSDIVKRLRAPVTVERNDGIRIEAAGEIERLRAGHDALHLKCSNYVAELGKAKTLNAGLEQRIRLASPAWAEEAREWVAEMERLRTIEDVLASDCLKLRDIRDELVAALEKVSTYFEPTCNVGKTIRAAIAKAKEQP